MPHGVPSSLALRASRRPTVGLLTTGFAYGPERRLFDGMLTAARAMDVNLVCFHGKRLNARDPADRRANLLYRLVDRRNCDALVVWAGALGEYISQAELREFCLGFGLPVVTVGDSLEGIPSVVFDFYSGMREQMMHLVRGHGYRRIAFIRGPEGHSEAEQRFRAYREVLSSCGIAFESSLVVSGDFLRDAGKRAVVALYDERHASFDAIAAVNDETALGALEELTRRGISVPHDVALTGFDDDDAVRWTTPQLTTVRFAIDAAAERAFRVLLAAIAGDTSAGETLLPLELRIRASCGCHPHAPGANEASAIASELARGSFARTVSKALETTSPLVVLEAKAEGWVRRIYDAFASDMAKMTATAVSEFRAVLSESLVERPADVGYDSSITVQLEATAWHDILVALHGVFASDPSLGVEERAHGRDLLWQIARTIVDFGQRLPTFGGWVREQHIWHVQELGHKLLHTFNFAGLAHAATEALPAAGIKRFAIALYEPGAEAPSDKVRLLAAVDGKRLLPEELASPIYESRELAPPSVFGVDGQCTLAVEPLVFEDHHLGFAVFEVESAAQGAILVALRKQLSAALEGAALIQRLEQRAIELEQSNRVQEEQRQKLIIAERMAWLGRLTAGIAHEMNTPVAAVRTSLMTLSDLIDEYRTSIGDESVGARDHEELAAEMDSVTLLAKRAAESAAKFVAELRSQTRDQGAKVGSVFNVVPVLHEALSLLKHPLEAAKCTLAYRPASHFIRVHGSPGGLAQLVTSLVTNAIDAYAVRGGGAIVLTLDSSEEGVELGVVDEGEGIPAGVLPRVFDPMFSTRSFGQRMGLGLSLARDIVEKEFRGSIDLSSRVGEGTTVRVRFPPVLS